MPDLTYVRFIDASGNVVRADGGSLFEPDDIGFSETVGSGSVLGSLSFSLGSGGLASLLDRVLVGGGNIAAVEVFRTTSRAGSTQIVSENVFKNVGFTEDGIDAGAGTHTFTALYSGMVESVAGPGPNGGPNTSAVGGWNRQMNVVDHALNTDIRGKAIDNAPSFSKDVVAAGGNGDTLEYYVRLADAKGGPLGGSQTGTAGWLRLAGADLALSGSVSFGPGGNGKAALGPVRLLLDGSRLDPVLLQALASRAGLQMEIAAYAPARGASPAHLVDDYRFGGVTVTSADTRLDPQSASQTYDLSCNQEVIEHYTTNPDGSVKLDSSAGLDATTNTPLSATSTRVPARNALLDAPPVPIAPTLPAERTYMRFIDASGHVVSLDGGSLFDADGVGFSGQGGPHTSFDLGFSMASSDLTSLLGQALVSGQHFAAIDVFQTTSLTGSTSVVAEEVFKDVVLTHEDIDAGAGTHGFVAVSRGLVESTAATHVDAGSSPAVTAGWNTAKNAPDNSTATDIAGHAITGNPFSYADVAATSGGAGNLDCYVRVTDAKGNDLVGGGRPGTAGWLRLDEAGLGFSEDATLGGAGGARPAFDPARIVLDGSGLDPVLLRSLASQAGLQVEVAAYARPRGAAPPQLVDDYRLGGVTVAAATTQVDTGSTTRTYGLSYAREVIEHYTTSIAGITTLGSSEGWDSSANAPLPAGSTLVPPRNAPVAAPPVPAAAILPAENTYMRFIDASGRVVTLDGGSLFRADGIGFSGEGGDRSALGTLSFDPGSGSLSVLLDQMLVSGRHLAAVEVFGTRGTAGSTRVVSEDVFKDVGLAGDDIDARAGAHTFTALYDGLVESVAGTNPAGGSATPVVAGWNGLRNVSDTMLNTGIDGRSIDNTPDFAKDVASAGGPGQELDCYVRLSDARGNALPGGGQGGTAGWIHLDSASLGLSGNVFLGAVGGGRPTFSPVQLVLDPNGLDPALLQALASQTGLRMEIAAYALAQGGSSPRLVDDDRFGGVTVASASTQLGSPFTSPTYDLSYSQEVLEHYTTGADGSPRLTGSEGWSETANATLTTTSPLVPSRNAPLQALPGTSGAPCFATGTLIRTEAGDVAVEALRVGDRVRTASGGLRPVRWLGHRRVDCRRHPEPGKVRPVRVRAHGFGAGLPARDLVLSPEHALFLDGHLVPVHALVDGVSVVQEAWERVTYHHVELDAHDVLLAEGLPAESYLDTGNRAQFANAPLVDLHPDFGAGTTGAAACAPLLLAGPRLEALRLALREARTSRPPAGGVDPHIREGRNTAAAR